MKCRFDTLAQAWRGSTPPWLRLWQVMLLISVCLTVLLWYSRGMGYRDRFGRWMDRRRAAAAEPMAVNSTRPSDGEGAVRFDTSVSAWLNLPASSLDLDTLNQDTLMLVRADDQSRVEVEISRGGGGDRVILTPRQPLEAATRYTFTILPGVADSRGVRIKPIAATFTTGETPDPSIHFQQVSLSSASDIGCTALAIGPDQKLYAGVDDGRILRYEIMSDGTLGPAETLNSLIKLSGGPRLLTGLCFDPRSTAAEPIAWVSHGHYAFTDAPDFTGRISRLSGRNLEQAEDVVINLPRSFRDHLTNQPSFGPDGALYFPQGSNTAFGAPDPGWGNRPERLLSASILRLDLSNLSETLPIDARTADGGGQYDPFAPNAPLTIHATGIRMAYDLLWASNGRLYVPTNGASAGGATPTSPDGKTPSIADVKETEHDWLFAVEPGRYYGHPNPQQGHYVFNGGNPTANTDFAEVRQYPVGTQPDPKWSRAVFDFGNHVSPNGIIEYRSNAFGGHLSGRLLICRFNGGNDIIALRLDAGGEVRSAQVGVPGLSGLKNPLDLVEDVRSGAIYVSEYGARRITLLRPVAAPVDARKSGSSMAASGP